MVNFRRRGGAMYSAYAPANAGRRTKRDRAARPSPPFAPKHKERARAERQAPRGRANIIIYDIIYDIRYAMQKNNLCKYNPGGNMRPQRTVQARNSAAIGRRMAKPVVDAGERSSPDGAAAVRRRICPRKRQTVRRRRRRTAPPSRHPPQIER